jgi:hypothetical protein
VEFRLGNPKGKDYLRNEGIDGFCGSMCVNVWSSLGQSSVDVYALLGSMKGKSLQQSRTIAFQEELYSVGYL